MTPTARHLGILLMLGSALGTLVAKEKESGPAGTRHLGMSGASAAIFLDARRVVVASDEDNRLRVYDAETGGPALSAWDASPGLDLGRGNPECDLEGAARVGSRLYWIGSHGRNKDGKFRPNRHRFFATEVDLTPEGPRWRAVGKASSGLVSAMLADPGLAALALAGASSQAPDSKGGLSIEGLAAGPAGSLWIGFRGPLSKGRAILVPLQNPDRVLEGHTPRFGPPTLLDLGGRGLRDMAWTGSEWILVAGATGGDQKGTRIYRWGGGVQTPVALDLPGLKHLNVEAVAVPPERPVRRLLLCSDDSHRDTQGAPSFRSRWVDLPAPIGGDRKDVPPGDPAIPQSRRP